MKISKNEKELTSNVRPGLSLKSMSIESMSIVIGEKVGVKVFAYDTKTVISTQMRHFRQL